MKRAWLVAKKDFGIYFKTPLAYVIMALTVALMSVFFDRIIEYYLRYAASGQMAHGAGSLTLNFAMEKFYYNMMVIFMFMIPGLTMRSFSSEKRDHTLELLVTAPLQTWELVLGKFLGIAVLYAGVLLACGIYSLVAIILGTNVDIPVLIVTNLGLFLIGMAFASIGIFTSSLTTNQFISFIVSFAIILVLFLIGAYEQSFSGPLSSLVSELNMVNRFTDFTKGVISVSHVVYFLSFFFFWLFLTFRVIDSQSWRS